MIINNNMMSMNAHRSMGVNAGGMGKSVEKLSTGLRVNRAADDAAGLAISEKMRGQIRGLNQASRNAQDGISMVQTAEGALDEVHSMLQRVRELAVQSSNDSNQDAVDREALDAEAKQLLGEIDSISTKSEFNKMKLLDGSFSGKKLQVGANESQTIEVSIGKMNKDGLGLDKLSLKEKTTKITNTKIEMTNTNEELDYKINFTAAGANAVGETTATYDDKTKTFTVTLKQNGQNAVGGANDQDVLDALNKISGKPSDVEFKLQNGQVSGAISAQPSNVATSKPTATDIVEVEFTLGNRRASSAAIKELDEAINKVSTQRSALGAVQNRLEHTIKNLDNSAENLQAAESRVRDVDMAKQMSRFTKDNILTQASQAMLAQANQLPQQVLQLLR